MTTRHELLVTLDAGTTGVRAIAFDTDTVEVGASYREFTQYFPNPGWVEHDAAEIWEVSTTVLAELMASLDRPIAAIGITNQRETVVAWNRRTGELVHRAIVWQDRRTAARCQELHDRGELDRIRTATGLVLDPYFSASKIEWLLTEGRVEVTDDLAIGTVDTWLLWNLTGGVDGGVLATDPSNASRTMLFDIRSMTWSDDLCSMFGVPAHVLAEVRPSAGRFGVTSGLGSIPDGIPISGIAGDQQSSLFGQACVEPGMTKNTYGTGSFVLMNVGTTCPPPSDGLLTTVAWTVPGPDGPVTQYALEGAIFVTGAAVQWLRDGLGIIDDSSEIGPLAETVDDNGGVVLVPAFVGLGAPWWDPLARGTILGLTRGSTRAHLARATIESMALQTADVMTAMSAAAAQPVAELRVDGGASVMDLLLQLQADLLGVPVVRARQSETTALGAALLAGLGEGIWASVEELSAHWRRDATFEPDAAVDPAVITQPWHRAIERSRDWER